MVYISPAGLRSFDFDNSKDFSSLDQWRGQGYIIPRFKMNDQILVQSIQMDQTDSLLVFDLLIVGKYFRIEELMQLALCSKTLYQRICKIFKEPKKSAYLEDGSDESGTKRTFSVSSSGSILIERPLDCHQGIDNLKLRLADIPKYYGLGFAAIRQVYAPSYALFSSYGTSDSFYFAAAKPTLYPLLNDVDPEVISRFPNLKSVLVQIENSETLFKVNRNFTVLPFLTTLILGSQTCPNFFGESLKGFFDQHVIDGKKGAYPQLLQEILPKMTNLQRLIFASDEMLPFSLAHLPRYCLRSLQDLYITSAHASPQLIQQLLKAAPRLRSLFLQSRHDQPINIHDVFMNLPEGFHRSLLEKITIQRVDIKVASTVSIPESDQIRTIVPNLKQIDYIPYYL